MVLGRIEQRQPATTPLGLPRGQCGCGCPSGQPFHLACECPSSDAKISSSEISRLLAYVSLHAPIARDHHVVWNNRLFPQRCGVQLLQCEWQRMVGSCYNGLGTVMMLMLLSRKLFCGAFAPIRKQRRLTSSVSGTRRMSQNSHHRATNNDFVLQETPIKYVMAPMVSQSDAPFRWLGRKYGCDLCFTQMMHAQNIVRDAKFRSSHLDIYRDGTVVDQLCRSQQNCLGSNKWKPFVWREGGPLVVQLAGHNANTMVQAAHLIRQHVHDSDDDPIIAGFDVNLGCPQGIARKGNYGAFLMEQDPQRVYSILTELREALPKHVTVSAKIRIPLNPSLLRERILRLRDTGIDFLTIHGRTLQENKTRTGPSRTNLIKKAMDCLQESKLKVIANGGIETLQDSIQLQATTKAHAVMSSEALLEDPTLFDGTRQSQATSARSKLDHDLRLAHEYLDLCEAYPPLPGSLGHVGGSFNVVRAHLFKMLHRYLQYVPELRNQLSHGRTNSLPQARRILFSIQEHYDTIQDEMDHHPSLSRESSWYRRHWNVAVNKNVHVRGDDYLRDERDEKLLSVQERKAMTKARITKLRQERLAKQEQATITGT